MQAAATVSPEWDILHANHIVHEALYLGLRGHKVHLAPPEAGDLEGQVRFASQLAVLSKEMAAEIDNALQ